MATGRSDLALAKTDRRFTDPAWTENPVYHRIEQAYLSWAAALRDLADESARTIRDHGRIERAAFTVNLLTSALAPTNFFWTNPRHRAGLRHRWDERASWRPELPVGPARQRRHAGPECVHRRPQPGCQPPALWWRGTRWRRCCSTRRPTETVLERPVLVVPPPIGRFYFLDLAPGRSFVEYSHTQESDVLWWAPAA